MKSKNEILKNLVQFTGSEKLYRYNLFGIESFLTDGVKYLAESAQCFWLINVILSHQIYKNVRNEEFQVWRLKKLENGEFIVVADDGNKNEITRQEIGDSDFPLDNVDLWFINKTLMLPTEY